MESEVKLKAYRISKSSLEQAREETINPEIYGALSLILETCSKDVQPRFAIIPDLQQHAGLVIAGTEQVTLPLESLLPALKELFRSGVLDEVRDNFNDQLLKSKLRFEELLESFR